MRVIDIVEAQARLEELVDGLAPGESLVIAVNGVPRAKVIALTEAKIAKLTQSSERNKTGDRKPRAGRR